MLELNVSNTLRILVKLRVMPHRELYEELLHAARRTSADTTAQNVVNTVWAVAELELRVDETQPAQRGVPRLSGRLHD